jgi:hypothetical protein
MLSGQQPAQCRRGSLIAGAALKQAYKIVARCAQHSIEFLG